MSEGAVTRYDIHAQARICDLDFSLLFLIAFGRHSGGNWARPLVPVHNMDIPLCIRFCYSRHNFLTVPCSFA